ncbi:hypothetical protein DL96DRAFT_1281215 [Flagelloscypha sp. PMI_526]|nr:hypothetical protein DL96DRAFT_1281215 [Flagelloscypha sp. PMI_526]
MADKLFIFESYIRVLTLLKEKKRRFFRGPSEAETWKDPAVYGCLIYGTQGIGKRNLLQLYLIISLALEHPILFFRSGMLYFHTPHGLFVSTANLGLIVESPLFHGLTLLVDLDIGFDQGAMYARKVWCIGTASPHAKDQDSFIKRLCAHQIVLDNPKFTELCEFY